MWTRLSNLKKMLHHFHVVHTGSICSMETILPPLLRSLNVPCTFKKAVKGIDELD